MRSLITESWLFASSVLISIGMIAGSVVVVSIGMLILGTGGAARLWSRLALEEVHVHRTVSEHRLYLGETVDVTLTVENRKPIPVPWIEVQTTLPRGMQVIGARTHLGGTGAVVVDRSTSLGRRDRIVWPLRLRAVRRGYFRVGPTRLRSGDIFGFFEREKTTGFPPDGIVVYPRIYTLPELGIDSARPFGDRRGGNRIYEDPSRVIGVRDYQPGDAMKRVDWKATARVMRLQSRLYEPSRTQAVIVALNIPTFAQPWQGSDPVLLERGIAVAASLARAAADGGAAVGLIANGSFPDADRPIRIGASNHPQQLNRVLEALAMVTSFTTSRMATELESPVHPIPVGATILVIGAIMTEDLAATLLRLRREGQLIHVVKTSRPPWTARLGSIPISEVAEVIEGFESEMAREGLPVVSAEDSTEAALGIRMPA